MFEVTEEEEIVILIFGVCFQCSMKNYWWKWLQWWLASCRIALGPGDFDRMHLSKFDSTSEVDNFFSHLFFENMERWNDCHILLHFVHKISFWLKNIIYALKYGRKCVFKPHLAWKNVNHSFLIAKNFIIKNVCR